MPSPFVILPRYLWNSVRTYLTIHDLVNLNQSSNYFKYIFREDNWKDTFFNARLDDIALVCDNTSTNYWQTCCKTYIGCTTILEVIEKIGYQRYDKQFKDQYNNGMAKNLRTTYLKIMGHTLDTCHHYQVYFKGKTFIWDGFDVIDNIVPITSPNTITDIKFNCNYKIEFIGTGTIADHKYTIFKRSGIGLSTVNILVPQYMSICNIEFISVQLFLHRQYEPYRGNIYYKPKRVYITDCGFNDAKLQYDKIEYVSISGCTFYNNSNIFMRHTEGNNYEEYCIVFSHCKLYEITGPCFVMITKQKKILIAITNNSFTKCGPLFHLLFGPIFMSPIVFRNNDVYDIPSCGLDGITADIENNTFVNVDKLFDHGQYDSNINIDNSNTFINSDAILPHVSNNFYYVKYDNELIESTFTIRSIALVIYLTICFIFLSS